MTQVPNTLTVLRALAVLAIAAFLIADGDAARAWALGLFVGAALTDFLDGYLARRFAVVSGFGRMMDHIADKLLVTVVLLMLVADGSVPGLHTLAAALIVMREVAISGLREHVAPQGLVIPSSLTGKWKTTVQLVAIAVLIAAPILPAATLAGIAGLVLLWVAAALTVVSGAQYAWGARAAFSPSASRRPD